LEGRIVAKGLVVDDVELQGGLAATGQFDDSLPDIRRQGVPARDQLAQSQIPDPPPIFDANGADERSASSITLTSAYLMLSGPRSAEQL
jgi:hypothetical protein